MKNKKFVLFSISVFLFLFTFISCEVGLGDAVDVSVPTVETKTPPVDAVIRGNFAIGGTWSDDGKIDFFKVVLKRNDNQSALIEGKDADVVKELIYTGVPKVDSEGKGTWCQLIKQTYNGKKIKDGKYEIEVTLFDKAGHSSKELRLITIDNNAPVIVLDRPASKVDTEEEFLDGYGQKLSLLGRAADDNEVDTIDINFFDKDKNLKATVHKDGVSNTIDETVALFRDPNADNNIFFDKYDAIYGSDKHGKELYTCSIIASDKARKYPETYPFINVKDGKVTNNLRDAQTDDDLKGNSVDYYYLYKDLSADVLKDYSVTDLYKMLSHTYVKQDSSRNGKTIPEELARQLLDYRKLKEGKFSLNPENNPTYSISGFKKINNFSDFATENFTLENDGQLFIDLYPGNDGYALKELPFENNYCLMMIPCTEGINGTIALDETNAKIINPANIEAKLQGNGYKIVAKVSKQDLKEFGNYIFRIGGVEKTVKEDGSVEIKYLPYGKDTVGNEVIVKYKDDSTNEEVSGLNVQYGFRFVPKGAAPVLNVDDITYQYFKKDSTLTIKGNMLIEEGTPSITMTLGNREKVILTQEFKNTTNNFFKYNDKTQEYDFQYNFEKLNSSDTKVTIVADGGTKYTTTKVMNVNYDEVAPLGDVILDTPSYTSGLDSWYKISQINIKVNNIKEDGTGISVIKAGIAGTDLIALNQKIDKEGNVYYEGFITFNKQGENSIAIELTDKAGNVTSLNKNVFIDTVSPTVALNLVDDEVLTGTKLVNGKKDVVVKLTPTENESGIKSIVINKLFGKDCNYEAKLIDNVYTVTIPQTVLTGNASGNVGCVITDNVGNSSETELFKMTLDTEAPAITFRDIVDADPSSTDLIDVNGKINLEGTLTDNQKVKASSVKLSYKKEADADYTVFKSDIGDKYSWSIPLDTTTIKDNTVYNFKFEASDEAGNYQESLIDLKVNQDSDRPVILIPTLNLSQEIIYLTNSKVVSGSISDDDGKIKYFGYNNDGSTNYTKLDIINGTWKIDNLREGENKLYFKVTDSNNKDWVSSATEAKANELKTTPKLEGSEGVVQTGLLKLRVDNKIPLVDPFNFSVLGPKPEVKDGATQNILDTYEKYTENAKTNEWSTFKPDLDVVGGKYSSFRIKINASDDNGIKSVTSVLNTPTIVTGSDISSDVANGEYIKEFALPKDLQSGTYDLTVSVFDNALQEKISTVSVIVDNTLPEVTMLENNLPAQINGGGELTLMGNVRGETRPETLYYAVVAGGSKSATEDTSYKPVFNKIKQDSSGTWAVYFDGDKDTSKMFTHSDTFVNHLISIYSNITQENIQTEDLSKQYQDFTSVLFKIKAVDSVGNESEFTKELIVDPQGDRPTLEISTPEELTTLGGVVKVFGTAKDEAGKMENIGVRNVWLQLISVAHNKNTNEITGNYGDVGYDSNNKTVSPNYTITEDDLDYMVDNGYEVYNMKTYYEGSPSNKKWTNASTLSKGESASDYGALVSFNGFSWSCVINGKGELNPLDKTSNPVRFVVYAKDGDNKISMAESRVVLFDSDTPEIKNLYLEKQDDSGNVISSVEYTEDMYVTGGNDAKYNWYVVGKATDNGSITKIELLNENDVITKTDIPTTQTKDYNFKYELGIPVDDSSVGSKVIKVKVHDNSDPVHTQTVSIKVNYDNKPPVLAKAPEEGTTSNNGYNIGKNVQQNNSFYSFGSRVSEDAYGRVNQSGLSFVAAYFVRPTANTNEGKLYNPLLSKNKNVDPTIIDTTKVDSGLYWITDTNATRTAVDNVIALSISNENIHTNSLVRINGGLYKIQNISGNTITLDGNPKRNDGEVVQATVTVEIANAFIIDNPTQESVPANGTIEEDGYYTKPVNDDGDRMIEGAVKGAGAVWDWSCSICSKNIPDGPIEIHYVVFDKAGNYATDCVEDAYVSNYAPRIAGVKINTDFNGDGKFSGTDEVIVTHSINTNDKFKQYATGITADGKPIFDWEKNVSGTSSSKPLPVSMTLGTSEVPVAVLKDKTEIIPEIVGGNGKIYYGYEKLGELDANYNVKPGTGEERTLITNGTTDYTISEAVGDEGKITVQLGDLLKIGDGKNQNFNFTFWDSTEGTTPFTDSQKVTLNMIFDVQAQNSDKPTVEIYQLYNDQNDANALHYKDKAENDKGAYAHDAAKGHADVIVENNIAKTKLSGIVEIKGTAFDKKRIEELQLQIPGMNNGSNTYHTVAKYSGGKLVPQDTYNITKTPKTLETNGIAFEITNEIGPNADGHTVEWKLTWNTEKLSSVTKYNLPIEMKVLNQGTITVDQGSSPSGLRSMDGKTWYGTATNAPVTSDASTYKVDVVPYVTNIVRTTNFGKTSRSRSGAVPLMRGEEARIEGFNIKEGATVSIGEGNSDVSCGTLTATLSFTVPTTAKTGKLNLTVNGVEAINNANDDTKVYNQEDGTAFVSGDDGNKVAYKVSDDRIINVWRISKNDTFKGSKNCVYPAMAKNKDGNLYASFTNYGQSKTYYTNEFTNGANVGVSSSTGDNNITPHGGVVTVFNGYDPPEETDIAIDPSTSEVNVFYAANYHGGRTDDWKGTGVGDAGGIYIFDKDASSHYNTRTHHNLYRGELYTYDNELNQFKNLRILRKGNYIYTSYYDRLRGSVKFSVINDSIKPDTTSSGIGWVTIDGVTDGYDKGTSGSYVGFDSFVVGDKQFENISRTETPGESVAMALDASGTVVKPVVVYMDAGSGDLRLARAKDAYPTVDADWKVQGVFPDGDINKGKTSGYISCAIGKDGVLHIVFQNTRSELVYISGTKDDTSGKYTFTNSKVIDDSGIWVDLTVKEEGKNGAKKSVPYISYISRTNSYDGMKLAFYDSSIDANLDGQAEGAWETMTAPSNEKITGVRTCIETNALDADSKTNAAAIGFCPGSDYRAMFYVGK